MNKVIERLKSIARGEHVPECRIGDIVFVIAAADRRRLVVKTDHAGTGIHVWFNFEEAEEYRSQHLDPEYCVIGIQLAALSQ